MWPGRRRPASSALLSGHFRPPSSGVSDFPLLRGDQVPTAPAAPTIVAHRGASDEAPENTLAAVRRAIARDADLVEVDVQRTKDGALVVMHDTTLARTT